MAAVLVLPRRSIFLVLADPKLEMGHASAHGLGTLPEGRNFAAGAGSDRLPPRADRVLGIERIEVE